MSIRITQNTLRLKNIATGEMQPVAMFDSGADKTLEELNETATQTINEIRSAGEEIKADINNIIDPTLTAEGKAADSKVTGEKISELKSDLIVMDNSKLTSPIGVEVGKYFRVASIGEDGKAILEAVNLPRKTWKMIRKITIPSVEYIGQTIEGVTFKNISCSSNYTANDIICISFETSSDGQELSGRDITSFSISYEYTNTANVHQGFLCLKNENGNYIPVNYFIGLKNATSLETKIINVSKEQSYIVGGVNPYSYPQNWVTKVDDILGVALTGHEMTSILGEGSIITFYAYGYWED